MQSQLPGDALPAKTKAPGGQRATPAPLVQVNLRQEQLWRSAL